MATIVLIRAAHCPRETIKALLGRCRQGRGAASKLTQEIDGYFVAEIDHPDTAKTFMDQLAQMNVDRHRVEPDAAPRLATKSASASAPRPRGPIRMQWTGDPEIDAAMRAAVVRYYNSLIPNTPPAKPKS